MTGSGAGLALADPSPVGADCHGDTTSAFARGGGGIGIYFNNTPDGHEVQDGEAIFREGCGQPGYRR